MSALFIINFLLAISTTVGMSITPLLATEHLGLSMFALGLIEGGSEFISTILKLASGNIYDRIKNKRYIFVLSTSLACISRILLMLPSASAIFGAKIVERLSNGLFGVPRDAFVGQNTTNKGLALGLLSCSKTLGCVIGPFIVSATVFYCGELQLQLTKVIGCCIVITLLAIFLSFFINSLHLTNITSSAFSLSEAKNIISKLTPVYIIALLFFLGRFNDGVIMLYLKKQGFPEWFYLATVAFFNLVMFIVSPILGMIIDKNKANIVLFITIASLVFFNISFYLIDFMPILFAILGLVCWGMQRVGAQISFAAIIFRTIPERFYGTAVGLYSVTSGIGTLIASATCGHLAQHSYALIFVFSGATSAICLILTYLLAPRLFSNIN